MAVPTVYSKLIEYSRTQSSNDRYKFKDITEIMRLHACGSAALPDTGIIMLGFGFDWINFDLYCPSINLFEKSSLNSVAIYSVMKAWRELTGQVLLERYGMTETGMILSNSYRLDRIPGSVGE